MRCFITRKKVKILTEIEESIFQRLSLDKKFIMFKNVIISFLPLFASNNIKTRKTIKTTYRKRLLKSSCFFDAYNPYTSEVFA